MSPCLPRPKDWPRQCSVHVTFLVSAGIALAGQLVLSEEQGPFL